MNQKEQGNRRLTKYKTWLVAPPIVPLGPQTLGPQILLISAPKTDIIRVELFFRRGTGGTLVSAVVYICIGIEIKC